MTVDACNTKVVVQREASGCHRPSGNVSAYQKQEASRSVIDLPFKD